MHRRKEGGRRVGKEEERAGEKEGKKEGRERKSEEAGLLNICLLKRNFVPVVSK